VAQAKDIIRTSKKGALKNGPRREHRLHGDAGHEIGAPAACFQGAKTVIKSLAARNDWMVNVPHAKSLESLFYARRGAILGVVMAPQPPLNAQGKGGGKTAPKNLKVLTPENLMAQMQTFPVALGVENQGGGNFCHEADRSLDTKPTKVKAREMIEMVADINAKFGDQRVHVTCWTCHLGSTKPEIARMPKSP